MLASRHRRPAYAVLVTVLVVVLAACTGGDPTTGPATTPTPTVDPGPQPEDVIATVVIPEAGADVEVGVHPLFRAGEYVVLALDFTPLTEPPGGGGVHLSNFNGPVAGNVTLRPPTNIRLVDLERDVIHHPGVDAEDQPVAVPSMWHHLRDGRPGRILIAYAAPPAEVSSLSLFLPGAPLVADTPMTIVGRNRSWEVSATARRVHGHVVVDLTVLATDDVTRSGWVLGSLRGFSTHRGTGSTTPMDIAGDATVLQGASMLYPMDYTTGPRPSYPEGEWLMVADLQGAARIDGGQARVYSYVFPRLDDDTVTFQVGDGIVFDDDFRVVDIPVAPDGVATSTPAPTSR